MVDKGMVVVLCILAIMGISLICTVVSRMLFFFFFASGNL